MVPGAAGRLAEFYWRHVHDLFWALAHELAVLYHLLKWWRYHFSPSRHLDR